MNKYLFLGIGTIIVIGLFALAFWFSGSQTQTQIENGQNIRLPVAGPISQSTATPSDQDTTISITSVDGGTIQTINFIADPATAKDPINAGYYYLGYHMNEGFPDPTASDNPPYVISYIDSTQYFNIALLQEPIGSVREEAQQYLMQHLGISQDQMCRLNYMVSVPDRVNSQFSSKNLGFSFCPGATVLPK